MPTMLHSMTITTTAQRIDVDRSTSAHELFHDLTCDQFEVPISRGWQ